MAKLVQTNFNYVVPDWRFQGKCRGTYLGKRPATEETIRKFLAANGTPPVSLVEITGSFVSPYIAK